MKLGEEKERDKKGKGEGRKRERYGERGKRDDRR